MFYRQLIFLFTTAFACASSDPAVQAVNQLGLSLLRQTEGNALISPWSLQQPLAMAYAGARGKTREEMAAALAYGGDDKALHEAFQKLSEVVEAIEPGAPGIKPLHAANRLFVAQDAPLKSDWLELTKKYYGAAAQVLDFSDPLAATKAINSWISGQTEKKIPAIIPEGSLHAQTKLVIANALYFDMPWDELFTKELTKTEPFFTSQVSSKKVPLMFKQHRQRYVHKDGFQIATVPYAGGQLQFVVILPDDASGLAKIEAGLTPAMLAECAVLGKSEVRLTLPRIKMEPPSMTMKRMLQKLGMKAAFSDVADLTGIWQTGEGKDPVIDEVFHRTFIELDENGTKAAAATAVIVRPKNGVPHEVAHVVVRCDHPFIFAIQHVTSGACLFIGRMSDPAPDMAEERNELSPEKK